MNKRVINIIILSVLLTALSVSLTRAELIVNEVLVNEPGSQSTLEWFELYNNSTEPILSLALYYVIVGSYTINFSNISKCICNRFLTIFRL